MPATIYRTLGVSMPRPERPLDPSAGPVPAFAAELRKLRLDAGNPKYLQMARLTGKSRTALAEAAGGDHLPTWETVEAYVTACGADPLPWRLRWEEVDEQLRPRRQSADRRPAGQDRTAPGVRSLDPPRLRTPAAEHRLVLLIGVLVVLTVLSTSVAGAMLLTRSNRQGELPSTDRPAVTLHWITPQNVEIHSADGGPVYLSAAPTQRCEQPDCAVSGKALQPGAYIAVACYTNGDVIRESTAEPPADNYGRDRKRYRSSVWFGAQEFNGQWGYLSVVDIAPPDRDGLGLPLCWSLQPLQPQ